MSPQFDILFHALADRYRLERELGHGGMATVYLADDLKHPRQVAIKVLQPDSAAAIGHERFLREIDVAARLTHPHILPLYDSGEANGHLYYVMPYIAGGSLRDWLERERQLSIEDASRIAREIASALAHAHREGFVHRDIKPENVLISDGIALVADFGIARTLSEVTAQQLTALGHMVGTPRYMAPEQALGSSVDGRADLYALACVTYEMLTGQTPFAGPAEGLIHQHLSVQARDVTELRPTVPRSVSSAIAKGLAKLPADRFANAAAFAEALASAATHLESPAIPNNLPRQRTQFIGRERELAECVRVLRDTRLLTITGIGGSGKTRLGIKLGETLLETFPDGVWFIDLAPLKDADRVTLTLAATLEVREEAGSPLVDAIARRLRDQRALIVLDNCEHVLTESAGLVDALMAATDGLKFIVTSREGLGVEGERLFALRSLSLPESTSSSDARAIERSEAVRLFVDRAQMVDAEFKLTGNAPAVVAEICRRLDGIPLAIELAVARVKVLKLEDIAARLDDRFRLLTGGSKTALPRHQTLRATIQWSYDQLTEAEQRLFRALSVFAGRWTLEAAVYVSGEAKDELSVLDLMTRLVDKSLVIVDREAEGESRYTMLETVRQYAQERMNETGEGGEFRNCHFLFFLGLAETAEDQLSGVAQAKWLTRLSQDRENLLAAHAWGKDSDGLGEEGLRLVSALRRFWFFFGLHDLGRRLVLEALDRPQAQARTAARAKALYCLSTLEFYLARYDEALTHAEETLAIARELGDVTAVTDGLHAVANGRLAMGDIRGAQLGYEQLIVLARQSGDIYRLSRGLGHLAELVRFQGDLDRSELLYDESLALQRKIGDQENVVTSLGNLAFVALARGDHEKAGPIIAEAMRTVDVRSVRKIGTLEAFAAWLGERNEWAPAARIFGAIEAERTRVNLVMREPVDESFFGPRIARIREALGDRAFEAAWAEGQAMGVDMAWAEAYRRLGEEPAR